MLTNIYVLCLLPLFTSSSLSIEILIIYVSFKSATAVGSKGFLPVHSLEELNFDYDTFYELINLDDTRTYPTEPAGNGGEIRQSDSIMTVVIEGKTPQGSHYQKCIWVVDNNGNCAEDLSM